MKVHLAVVAATISCSAAVPAKWPTVTGIQIDEISKIEHHTDAYRVDLGFVVRRGQPFTLHMEVDEAPLHPSALKLEICAETTGGKCNDFQAKITGKVEGQDQTYSVEVSADKAAPIRKYDELKMFLTDGDSRMEGSSYIYPFPVYVLYNPYLEDDHTYMANNTEFVLNEWGGVSTGSLHDHETMDWYYGHLDQRALDAAFYVIRAMDVAKGADPANVAFHMARHQGMVNQTSVGPLRGDVHGVLSGRWAEDFPGGYPPDHWSSTIDIIQAWKDDDKTPVKYGQCWVFGALLTTLTRAVGIPARQVSAFDARIDASAKLYEDHRVHHIVNRYVDKMGKQRKIEGKVWNFHSWVDVYISNKNKQYSGWHALDGTPGGLGPASLKAIYEQSSHEGNDTVTEISTVHATVRDILVNCTDADGSNEGETCDMAKLVKAKTNGVDLIVSAQPHVRNMTYNMTHEYVDPAKDAYIPFAHDPWHPRTTAANNALHHALVVAASLIDVTTEGLPTRVIPGETYRGYVTVKALEGQQPVNVRIGCVVDLLTHEGDVLQEVYTKYDETTIKAGDTSHTVLVIPSELYMNKHVRKHDYLQVRVVASTDEGEFDIEHHSVLFVAPVHLLSPPLVASTDSDTVAIVIGPNPFAFALERVCVSGRTHTGGLRLRHSDDHTDDIRCMTLLAGETRSVHMTVDGSSANARHSDAHHVIVSVSSPHWPTVHRYADITVVKPPKD